MEKEEDEVVLFRTVVYCGKNHQRDEDSDSENETKRRNSIPSPEPMLFDNESSSSETENDLEENSLRSKKHIRVSKNFRFTKLKIKVPPEIKKKFSGKKPFDFYCMFVDDELLQKMVDATNSYAKTCLENNSTPNTWIQPWHETNIAEMRKFLGMIMWMGLVKYPTLNSYWCRDLLYTNAITAEISRSKFQLLSYMWRFSSGDENNFDQIVPLLNDLKRKFQECVIPQEVFSVAKSFIPFEHRNRGLNLLTLNLKGGYVYDFSVHIGREFHIVKSHHTMQLAKKLLDKGRVLCTDENWTSLNLAEQLQIRRTHLLGPIQQPIPTRLRNKKLRPNESCSEVIRPGICIQKYARPREQYLLATRRKIRTTQLKEYHKIRTFTEISEQLQFTNNVILENFNSYQRLAIEFLVTCSLVNACYLYRKVCSKKISSTRFKEDVVQNLFEIFSAETTRKRSAKQDSQGNLELEHQLVRQEKRNRCSACYERVAAEFGRKHAANCGSKGFYKCNACEKYYCVECFFKLHSSGKLYNK